MNRDISKGGIIGAILGTLASSKVIKSYESPGQKVAKAGLFAGLGYLVGRWLEKFLYKKN